MTTRKKQSIETPKTTLIKPRDVFKAELLERIKIGEELVGRNIKQVTELDILNKDFSNWDDYNEELIKQAFNNPYSEYYSEYSRVNQMVGFFGFRNNVNTNHPAYKLQLAKEKIENSMTILKRLVDKLPLIEQEDGIVPYQTQSRAFYNRGFIVHGHNDTIKLEVARFLENDLNRKAIILHEQVNKGQTIIEKFENNSSVDFAIALWTADDVGKLKTESDFRNRARQNVIFETGFFIGVLGRENVIVLYEDGVEIPSDYSGVIFIRIADNWKDNLRKEINAIYQF